MLKVLHLYADTRWTGPAEPVVNLVVALRRRGFAVTFACRRPAGQPRKSLAQKAAARGVEPELDFHLNRYGNPIHLVADVIRLKRYLKVNAIDIVHTHLSHDHLIGGLAAGDCCVIRTNHKAVPLQNNLGNRLLFRRYTDAYLGFTQSSAEQDSTSFGLSSERVFVINPAVDLTRFDPSRPYNDVRSSLSFAPHIVLGGLVARAQRHRRIDVLLHAIKQASPRLANFRFLLIGRSKPFVKEWIERADLEQIVLPVGYRADDYLDHIRSLDFQVFQVPGSDGTCRAVRELMALGKPVIAARRGILPEIVPHEQAGLVIDDTAENLAEAMVRLAQNADLRRRLGAGAHKYAGQHFDLEHQADAVAAIYQQVARASPF